MLKEFFEAVSGQAVLANTPKVVTPAAEPGHVYFIAQEGGELERHTAEPRPRGHQALSLQAVAEFAQRFRGEGACVWYSRHKVVAVLKDESRRDAVTLALGFSKPMAALMEMEKAGHGMKQADLILLLRTVFADCGPAVPELIACLRVVKFESGQVVDSRVEHAKSSLGRDIRDQVTGARAIPEQVVLEAPVFESAFPDVKSQVRVAVDPNPSTGNFRLIPLAGEIEVAVAHGEQVIGDKLAGLLKEAGVPLYYGQP